MKPNKILLIRSQDILTDSRVQRYEKWYKENNIDFHILGWNRGGTVIQRDNTDYCLIKAEYNMGINAIKYRIKWNIYILKYLLRNQRNYNIIHACDFDTIIPSLIMKIFGKRVIFDIFDWFSDEVKTGKVLIDFIINSLEKLATKLADLTILCEEERLEQIKVEPSKYIVIPNIPTIPLAKKATDQINHNHVTIAYVGGFYPDRGLEQLLNSIPKFPHIQLYIAGFGNMSLQNQAQKVSESCSNVTYYGKVDYQEAVQIMKQSDLLYGMYYKENRNNIFAAPNKFYEAIFLEKPLITTRGTLVGNKVEKNNIGFIIDEGQTALEDFLGQLSSTKIKEKTTEIQYIRPIYESRWSLCMDQYGEFINK